MKTGDSYAGGLFVQSCCVAGLVSSEHKQPEEAGLKSLTFSEKNRVVDHLMTTKRLNCMESSAQLGPIRPPYWRQFRCHSFSLSLPNF